MTSHAPVRPSALARRAAVVLLIGVGCVGTPATASAEAPALTAVQLIERAAAAASAPTPAPTVARTPAPTAAPAVVRTVRSPIAFRTSRRADASRYRGTEVVVQRGRTGVLERTYADAGPAGRKVLRERRVQEPVTRVVAVGTKPRPTYGGLDWAALARCESGGNPRAVSRTGKYRGLYQFSLATWRSVGGTGDPAAHSRDSQTARAYALYERDGRAPWPHCGRHL